MQEKTKAQRRKALDKHRKGDVTLHVPFDRGDMMFVPEGIISFYDMSKE